MTLINAILSPTAQIIAQFIASGVVVITLFFTARTYLRLRNTEQIKISHDIFKQYSDLEKESAELKVDNKNNEPKNDWASRYFSTLEWLSLLVNTKEIKNKRLIAFYHDLIIESYEKILPQYYSSEEIKNEYIYPEFQIFYRNLKEGKVKSFKHINPNQSV
jgi:hypothetical protein